MTSTKTLCSPPSLPSSYILNVWPRARFILMKKVYKDDNNKFEPWRKRI